MKIPAFIFFFGISVLSVFSQITITMPARLQVYALKPDGTQVMMNTESLSIGYEQLHMTGELFAPELFPWPMTWGLPVIQGWTIR